jgi:dTDP-4-amino-4,6-dideoxygalactose transaminase
VKKIFVTQPLLPPVEDFIEEVKKIFDNKWLTNMGAEHQALEKKLKKYLKVQDLSMTVNGHLALELSLQALDLDSKIDNGEVITTPFTFISTTHSIVRNRLKPVFADIDPETCVITSKTIEPLINNKTVAIMPVHVYGNICDVVGIEKLAKKHNLKVIYDAAHAFGEEVKINERSFGVGSFGDISIFSLHATKVFNSIEGGVACFHDNKIGKRIYNLKNFGIMYNNPDYIEAVGANAKMNEFQAAMGLCNLKYVEEAIKMRRIIAERYYEMLSDINGLVFPTFNKPKVNISKKNYAYMPILFNFGISSKDLRDKIMSVLASKNIFTRKYFFPLTNDAQCYSKLFSSSGKNHSNPTPIAKKIADSILTLPIYPNLDLSEVDNICNIIKGTLNNDK